MISRRIVLVALFGLLVVGPVAAQAQDVSVTPDVVYGHKYGMALTFDVFTPPNANGAAVLNMVSGGWRSQWRPHASSQQRYQPLLDKGFTVIAVRHGSSPKFIIPELVPDVRRAVRYIRLNARRWGVDANRLGVWGGSAGPLPPQISLREFRTSGRWEPGPSPSTRRRSGTESGSLRRPRPGRPSGC